MTPLTLQSHFCIESARRSNACTAARMDMYDEAIARLQSGLDREPLIAPVASGSFAGGGLTQPAVSRSMGEQHGKQTCQEAHNCHEAVAPKDLGGAMNLGAKRHSRGSVRPLPTNANDNAVRP